MKIVHLAQEDADLTEGRGPMVTIAAFANRQDAEKTVEGRGVMGVGDGEVKTLIVYDS